MSSTQSTYSIMPNGAEDRKARIASRELISLLTAVVISFGVVLYPIVKEYLKKPEEKEQIPVQAKKVINYSQLSAPPPIDLEKPPPEAFKVPQKVEQKKFIQPVAKKDDEVLEEEYIPTMDELQESQISTVDVEGVDSVVVDVEAIVEEPIPVKEEALSFVEQMPSFQGGDMAMMKYLGQNLQYPDIAREMNIQGVVYVRFVVEPTGQIAEVEVIRGVFKALDEEAVRVIKAMPAWIPGQQNGRKVRVYYTIPIRFELR